MTNEVLMGEEREAGWEKLEAYVTVKLLPQYASLLPDLFQCPKFRGLMRGAAAQNFDDKQVTRMVENVLILRGLVKPGA